MSSEGNKTTRYRAKARYLVVLSRRKIPPIRGISVRAAQIPAEFENVVTIEKKRDILLPTTIPEKLCLLIKLASSHMPPVYETTTKWMFMRLIEISPGSS